MLQTKSEVQSMFIWDERELVSNELINRINNKYDVEAKKVNQILDCHDSSTMMLLILRNDDVKNMRSLRALIESTESKTILIIDGGNLEYYIPFLSSNLQGLVSLDFFLKNIELIIRNLRNGITILEPKLHYPMTTEIFQMKTFKKPISRFFLREDKIEHLLRKNEIDVLQLLLDGFNNQRIAEELYFSSSNVSAIVSSILKKIYARDRTDLVVKVIQNDWVDCIR